MARIDNSIYFQQQMPDAFGSYDRGLRMSDMARKRKLEKEAMTEKEAVKDAYSQSIEQGEDGSFQFNRNALLSDLSKASPQKALKQQQAFQKQDQEDEKTQLESALKKMELGNKLLASAYDENSYERVKNRAVELGVAQPGSMPEQYDPQWVKQSLMRNLDAKDRLEQKFKRDELDWKKDKFYAEQKQNAKGRGRAQNLTPAEDRVDKEFAKDYADFVAGGGFSNIKSNIDTLKGVKKQLEETDTDAASGGFVGNVNKLPLIGEALTPTSTDVQDRVRSVIMQSLKKILGGQFTEREGEKLVNTAFNPRLDEETNKKRLDDTIEKIERMAQAKTDAANYYQNFGTLKGYKGRLPRSFMPDVEEEGQSYVDYSDPAGRAGATSSWGMNEAQADEEESPVYRTDEIEWAD